MTKEHERIARLAGGVEYPGDGYRREVYARAILKMLEFNEWVSVENKMPRECWPVEVYIHREDEIAVACYEEKEGWYLSYNTDLLEYPPTHWRYIIPPGDLSAICEHLGVEMIKNEQTK